MAWQPLAFILSVELSAARSAAPLPYCIVLTLGGACLERANLPVDLFFELLPRSKVLLEQLQSKEGVYKKKVARISFSAGRSTRPGFETFKRLRRLLTGKSSCMVTVRP